VTEHLVAWLGAERAGELVRTRRGDLRFVADADAPPITVATEGARAEWRPAFTRAWFDGLLPEGGMPSSRSCGAWSGATGREPLSTGRG
jgi:hypothetical protein